MLHIMAVIVMVLAILNIALCIYDIVKKKQIALNIMSVLVQIMIVLVCMAVTK